MADADHNSEKAGRADAQAILNTRGAIHRILIATDFCATSEAAVNMGAMLAKKFQASVILLHVVDLGARSSDANADCERVRSELWRAGLKRLDQATRDLNALGIEAEAVIREGIPREEILKAGNGCDLILIGSNSPRRLWKLFRRRTVEGVLEAAKNPVLVATPRLEIAL